MEKLIMHSSKSAQVQPWKPNPKLLMGSDQSRQRVWDCGSSLYDSFELNSFKRNLDSACHSRSLSLPHLDDRLQLQPPLPPKRGSRVSRSLKKLVRSVFSGRKLKSDSGKGNVVVLSTITEAEDKAEIDDSERFMLRSVSMQFLHPV